MMPIYIGQLTSEVRSVAPAPAPDGDDERENRWDKGPVLATVLAGVERDRLRTATGHGRD